MVAEKLKAKKTQAAKKLKHFFSQKLKVPEDFLKSMGKNSIYGFFLTKYCHEMAYLDRKAFSNP